MGLHQSVLEGECGAKTVHMYINGKMRPLETIPRMGVRRMKEGVNSTIIHFIHCKNFCKCHNVPSAQQ
jgi:hypothetical protein